MVFLPLEIDSRQECERLFEDIIREEGQRVLSAVHPGAIEKCRIKGHRHAHRRSAVTGIGGALKEEPGRGDIARRE